MDLTLTEHQNMLQNATRELRERDFAKRELVALDAGKEELGSRWTTLCSMGILGLLVPEELGGAGGSLMDAAVVYEELGRGPVPGPHLSSGVLAALVLLAASNEELRGSLLPSVITGEKTFALAVTEEDYGWSGNFIHSMARRTPTGYQLDGTKLYVLDAMDVTDLIVAARLDNGKIGLFAIPAVEQGIARRPLPGFAAGLAEVILSNVYLSDDALLNNDGSDGWAILDGVFGKAQLLLSAYQVGGLAEVFDMSLLYSQSRKQFNQPIGRFQRVQDHVIDIVNGLDSAKWTTYEAIWKADSGHDDALIAGHTAALVASDAYYFGCNSAHDVHAGIGIVREYGLTLHTKMSRTLYHYLGSPRYHRKKIAAALGL